MDRPGQWPAKTLTAEQDRQDLARREADMEQHLSFSYALFDLGETELLGCVHIEPSVELEVGADISWWVIDWLIDSPIEQALDSSVQAWMVADWPISPARYAWQPLKPGRVGRVRTTRRSEVCEWCATCCVWPAQAYCNTLEAAPLAHIGKESPL
jgi:hypothetical protein